MNKDFLAGIRAAEADRKKRERAETAAALKDMMRRRDPVEIEKRRKRERAKDKKSGLHDRIRKIISYMESARSLAKELRLMAETENPLPFADTMTQAGFLRSYELLVKELGPWSVAVPEMKKVGPKQIE